MSSQINHKERAHSALGASSSKRWFACPGSIPLSEGIEQKETVYAKEGTAAHELAETALVEDKDAIEYVGEEFYEVEVTEEMAEAVQVYIDEIRKIGGEGKEIYIEQKFSLDWIDPELYGTNDAAIHDPFRKLTILDYKHGRGVPVDAVDNPQLLYYALGAARGVEVDEIELVIVQPRCDHPIGPVRRWSISPERLKEFEEELKAAVAKVNEERTKPQGAELTLEAGDHCKFCPAAGFCPKLKDKALEVAQADFGEEEEIVLPDPRDLAPEVLTKVLQGANLVKGWIDSVEKYAHDQMQSGVKIPGYKLVKRRANRKWECELTVKQEFGPIFGDDIYTKKLKSPAQLEKLCGKEEVEKLSFKPDTGTTMAPDNDKRPAVQSTVEQDFMDI